MASRKKRINEFAWIEYWEKSYRIAVGGNFSEMMFNGEVISEKKLKELSSCIKFALEHSRKLGRNALREDIRRLMKEE